MKTLVLITLFLLTHFMGCTNETCNCEDDEDESCFTGDDDDDNDDNDDDNDDDDDDDDNDDIDTGEDDTSDTENGQDDFDDTDSETESDAPTCIEINYIGAIQEDTVWTNHVADPTIPDYCIRRDTKYDAALTIEPGVLIHFDAEASLEIYEHNGVLIAAGTEDERIVFTSAAEEPGAWEGIIVGSGDVQNKLAYVDVLYAGAQGAAVVIEDRTTAPGKLSLSHTTISFSKGIGLQSKYSLSTTGGTIHKMENVTISHNLNAPVMLPPNQVTNLDPSSNYSKENGRNVIVIDGTKPNGGKVNQLNEHLWPLIKDGTPYVVDGEITVETGLKIAPGVQLFFEPESRLETENKGYLTAVGTDALPIIFTGTINTEPSWRGLLFASADIRNKLSYVNISYGGSSSIDTIWMNIKTNIGVRGKGAETKLNITHSNITNSGGYGIYAQEDTSLVEENNVFENNALADIEQEQP